jgi:hypothetical protein
MSISPLLPLAPPESGIANLQRSQYFQTRQSDLKQLGQALQSGNLAGAQQEFNDIESLAQNGPLDGEAFAVKAREQDFTTIGQALQSGDLAGAQQAFTELQSTFKSGSDLGGQGSSAPSNSPASSSSPSQAAGVNLVG